MDRDRDLVAVMLPGQGGALRDRARAVADAEGLRAWMRDAAARIAERAGDGRAAIFIAKVEAVLPQDEPTVT